MSLVKFNPRENNLLCDVFNVQKEMSKMLSDFWNEDETIGRLQEWYPSADITETKDAFTVKVELPGVTKENVKITLQENILTIQGEKKLESESKDRSVHRIERNYGAFSRSFRMPSSVKGEKIDAGYKDGVLTIVLPKAEEAKTKEIEIKF